MRDSIPDAWRALPTITLQHDDWHEPSVRAEAEAYASISGKPIHVLPPVCPDEPGPESPIF